MGLEGSVPFTRFQILVQVEDRERETHKKMRAEENFRRKVIMQIRHERT